MFALVCVRARSCCILYTAELPPKSLRAVHFIYQCHLSWYFGLLAAADKMPPPRVGPLLPPVMHSRRFRQINLPKRFSVLYFSSVNKK